jgi:hypothetical protein
MLAPTVGHAPAPLDCQLGAWLSMGPPSMILRLGAAKRRGLFCLYVFRRRHDGGSADTRRVAACGMEEFDLRGPLTGFDCMIQSSSMSAGRNVV